jgi:endo-1,4-beta-xylanase
MTPKKWFFLYFCLLNAVNVLTQNPIGLRAASFLRGILFGAESSVDNIRRNVDGQYVQKIKDNYQLIVLENELKQQNIWKGEEIYNFTDPDFILGATSNSTGWAQQNSMQIRGHNLGWGKDKYIPHWLLEEESSITPDKVKQLLSDYIHTVVGRYRGKIPWWDVINEGIDDYNNTNPFNLRDCFWLRKLGPDFMKYAFTFAHEADPDAQLYYNEYGIESIGSKATQTIALFNWLPSEGVTVHGIGLQWRIGVSMNVTPGDGHY